MNMTNLWEHLMEFLSAERLSHVPTPFSSCHRLTRGHSNIRSWSCNRWGEKRVTGYPRPLLPLLDHSCRLRWPIGDMGKTVRLLYVLGDRQYVYGTKIGHLAEISMRMPNGKTVQSASWAEILEGLSP